MSFAILSKAAPIVEAADQCETCFTGRVARGEFSCAFCKEACRRENEAAARRRLAEIATRILATANCAPRELVELLAHQKETTKRA